ncbi:MAG: ABC transporter permease [Chloroflexota bacterium]
MSAMEAIVSEESPSLTTRDTIPAPTGRGNRPPSFWLIAWTVLKHRPTGMLGLIIILFFVVLAIIGPYLYPSTLPTDVDHLLSPPSRAHLLGTDFEGTDVLALVVTGTRYVLLSAGLAGLFIVVIGTVLGLLSGYYRGATDSVIMRVTDFVLTIPGFPLLVVLSTIWRFSDPLSIGIVLGIVGWGALARAVRSQILSLRERTFIEASKGLGFSSFHIITREIFPNIAPFIGMKFLLGVTGAMYAEVGLFFLGVVPFSVNNWGVMLNLAFTQAGAMYSSNSLMYLLSPLACILLVTLGVVLFLDAVDEMLNPRLRMG